MAIRICFANFWPAFTAAKGAYFLPYVFDQAFDSVELTDDMTSADVVVSSVFGDTPTPPRKTIQFIGENIRPSLGHFRYSLSFDYDTTEEGIFACRFGGGVWRGPDSPSDGDSGHRLGPGSPTDTRISFR